MKKVFEEKDCFHYHALYRASNNFGASVTRNTHSYGGSEGLYELGVIKFNNEDDFDYRLIYDTPITPDGDVVGYLTIDEVNNILDLIEKLTEDGKLLNGCNNIINF